MAVGLLDRIGELRAKARDVVLRFAQRDAAGEVKPADAKALAENLSIAGMTEEQYRERVDLHREHERLRAAVGDMNAVGAELAAARKALADHKAETARIVAERRPQERKHVAHVQGLAETLDAMQAAKGRLQTFEAEHAIELGLEPTDLDRFALKCGGGHPRYGIASFLPGPAGAETVFVDKKTFRREGAKRGRILNAANLGAERQYLQKVGDWNGKLRRTFGGDYVLPADPRPTKVEVSWDDIVSKRVEVTEDDLRAADEAEAQRREPTR